MKNTWQIAGAFFALILSVAGNLYSNARLAGVDESERVLSRLSAQILRHQDIAVSSVLLAASTPDEGHDQRRLQAIAERDRLLREALAVAETDKTEARLGEIGKVGRRMAEIEKEAMDYIGRNDWAFALRILQEEDYRQARGDFEATLGQMLGALDETVRQEAADANRIAYGAQALVIISLVLLVVVFLRQSRQQREALARESSLGEQLRSSNDNLELRIAERTNELASRGAELQRVMAETDRRLQAEEKITKLAKSLRGDLSVEEVGERALDRIGRALDVPMAALFAQRQGAQLVRVASRAYPEGQSAGRVVAIGRGLPGEAFRSGKRLVTRDLPDGVFFELGFGRFKPHHMIDLPLIHNGRPVGVLELALARDLDEFDDAWLRRAAENVASALRFSLDEEERKRAEKRLHFTQDAVDKGAEPVLWIEPDSGRIEYANEAACRQLGYGREELIGSDGFIIHVDFTKDMMPGFIARMKQDTIRGLKARQKTKDGRLIDVEMNLMLAEYDDEPLIVASAKDITEQKRAARAIKESEARVREILDSSPTGVAVVGPDGKIRFANRRLAEIYGYSRDELVGMRASDTYWNPDDRKTYLAEMTAKGQVRGLEFRMRPKGDGELWVSMDADETVVGGEKTIFTWIYDITERRKAEMELKRVQEQQRLSAFVLDNAAEAIIFTDGEGIIRRANRMAGELSGWPAGELIGRPAGDLVEGIDHRVWGLIWNAVRGRTIDTPGEQKIRVRGAASIPAETLSKFVAFGGEEYICTFFRDITERKRSEEEVRRARDAAEEAARAKAIFLATMSHEIRTPMNGVMSMAELLDQTDLTEDQRNMTRVIRQSADALRTVINDILDFSKIEAGKLEIERIEIDLVDLTESVGDLLAPRAEEKWLGFQVEIEPSMPRKVLGDPSRIRQILLNLCGNAVKFTEEGWVSIVAGGRREGDQWLARFEVVDTGIGLTAEQQGRLFQAFAQAEGSTSRKFGGTGLGLSICKRLVELMGGSIGVKSEAGKGSIFWFELPLGVEAWAAHHPEAELTGARVLLAQYGEREERTLRRYLEHGGVGKVDAVTGKGGELGSRLEALEKGYDLVLVSAREGASALKGVLEELRRHGATASSRDAVTAPHLAASVLRADARSLSDMQWLATLTTPIRMRRLWQVVGAAIGKVDLAKVADRDEPKLAEYEAPALAEALSAGVAILVAEDNGTNQIVIRRILNRLGFAHEMAGNGVEALKLWEEKRGSYGLLLSDFHMPEMDGFELTQAIREREAKAGYPRLPIVALTADALPQTEKQCLDAGMDGYLRKPIEMPALVAALEKWLPNALNLRKEKGAAKAKPPEPAPPAPQPAAEPQGAILDRSRLEEIFGDEEDEAKAFVASFVSHAQGMVDDVARHLEAGEATEAREVAHALKGAARSVGAMRLGDAAAEVQDCLDRKDVDAARGSFPAIQATYRDFADHVQSLGWQAETAEGS